jgi:hypothetical protein
MISLRLFFVVLIALLSLIQVLQQAVLAPADPFAPGQERRRYRLDQLYNPHLISYKLDHIAAQKPFDVMVFGNSTIMALGQEHLNGHGRFFNVAVPGSSFGSSVSLAQALAREGRLAPTIVIMIENLNHFTQQVPMLPAPLRWRDGLSQVAAVLISGEISLYQKLRFTARMIKLEAEIFLAFFNPRILQAHLAVILADWLPPESPGPRPGLLWEGYSPDGSGAGMIARVPGVIAAAPRQDQPQVLPDILAHDVKRLAALAARHRVIVYESPVEPSTHADYASHPLPRVVRLREMFAAACARNGIECHAAPLLGRPGEPSLWMDHYHPPATVLGPWIDDLLKQPPRLARHAVQ